MLPNHDSLISHGFSQLSRVLLGGPWAPHGGLLGLSRQGTNRPKTLKGPLVPLLVGLVVWCHLALLPNHETLKSVGCCNLFQLHKGPPGKPLGPTWGPLGATSVQRSLGQDVSEAPWGPLLALRVGPDVWCHLDLLPNHDSLINHGLSQLFSSSWEALGPHMGVSWGSSGKAPSGQKHSRALLSLFLLVLLFGATLTCCQTTNNRNTLILPAFRAPLTSSWKALGPHVGGISEPQASQSRWVKMCHIKPLQALLLLRVTLTCFQPTNQLTLPSQRFHHAAWVHELAGPAVCAKRLNNISYSRCYENETTYRERHQKCRRLVAIGSSVASAT